jgi:hypothetical protein
MSFKSSLLVVKVRCVLLWASCSYKIIYTKLSFFQTQIFLQICDILFFLFTTDGNPIFLALRTTESRETDSLSENFPAAPACEIAPSRAYFVTVPHVRRFLCVHSFQELLTRETIPLLAFSWLVRRPPLSAYFTVKLPRETVFTACFVAARHLRQSLSLHTLQQRLLVRQSLYLRTLQQRPPVRPRSVPSSPSA